MVQEPVDGCGGQGLGHQLVERGGVEVGGERDGAFLVRGVDEALWALGGVGGHRQQADVIDDDQICSQDTGDGLGDGVVGAVPAQQDAEVLEGEQATFRPCSTACCPRASSRKVFPVPDGPQRTRFPRRWTDLVTAVRGRQIQCA